MELDGGRVFGTDKLSAVVVVVVESVGFLVVTVVFVGFVVVVAGRRVVVVETMVVVDAGEVVVGATVVGAAVVDEVCAPALVEPVVRSTNKTPADTATTAHPATANRNATLFVFTDLASRTDGGLVEGMSTPNTTADGSDTSTSCDQRQFVASTENRRSGTDRSDFAWLADHPYAILRARTVLAT